MIKMRVEGVDDVMKEMIRLGERGHREAEKAVRSTTEKVRSDAIKSIQRGPKTGIVYEREGGQNLSPFHRASAPGEPPATDTGNLVSSSTASTKDLTGTVAFNAEYAEGLEFGTFKVEPRPFLRPAMKANEKHFIDALERGLRRASGAFEE